MSNSFRESPGPRRAPEEALAAWREQSQPILNVPVIRFRSKTVTMGAPLPVSLGSSGTQAAVESALQSKGWLFIIPYDADRNSLHSHGLLAHVLSASTDGTMLLVSCFARAQAEDLRSEGDMCLASGRTLPDVGALSNETRSAIESELGFIARTTYDLPSTLGKQMRKVQPDARFLDAVAAALGRTDFVRLDGFDLRAFVEEQRLEERGRQWLSALQGWRKRVEKG